jgi:hemolysin activation/secretion protein
MRRRPVVIRVHASTLHRHREGFFFLKTLQPSTLSLALGLVLGGAVVHAQAQQAPTIGDAVRQTQPLPPALARPAAPLPLPGGVPPAALRALPDGGRAIAVRQFALEGNRVIDSPTLLALLQSEQGKSLTLAQLDELAARITGHYRASGYFVARAYIPAQELSDGILTIRVVEGNYGRFILDNRSRVNDAVVQRLLDDIKGRDIVSLDTLERAMLIINDTPGARVVQADVMPGDQVGTSDFAIATEATPAVAGYILLDNHGSAYTGKQRLSFNADWQSPGGRGERLSASGMATRHGGLLNGRLAYSMLAAGDGSRAELALSRTTYELGDVYRALDATGTASAAEFSLSKPLKRTRKDSIDAGLSLAYKDLKDQIGSVGTSIGKRLTSLNASLARRSEGSLLGLYGQSQCSASLTIGRLDFKDALAEALDAAGDATQGGYARLNLAALRTSVLPAQFTLSTGIKAQAALGKQKLDGVERMSVTGSGAVAAYPSGELSGDHAALLRAELARALPAQVSASVFADYGWAKAVNAAAGVDATRSLGDVGLGLSALRGGLLLKLQLAHRIGGGAALSEPVSRTRLLFQAGWVM